MKRKRKIYRHLKTLDEAKELLFSRFSGLTTGVEEIPVRDALKRVLAEPVAARRSVPSYHQAAMDGIAVKASDTFGALPERPVFIPKGDRALEVDTGEPLPGGFDAVVMIEKVEEHDDSWEVRDAAYPFRNVRKVGEDIVKGEIILPARFKIRAFDQAALLAAGVIKVRVFERPRVLIIPTGSELLLPEDAPDPLPAGSLMEFNGQMMKSMAEECGAHATLMEPVPDEPEVLRREVERALKEGFHLVLINAGSSTGREDFTPGLLDEMGELMAHGVTVMPGKPTVMAAVSDRPVLGIPGYPVSAAVAMREFAVPLLHLLQGLAPRRYEEVPVTVGRKLPSRLGLEEHVRVILGRVGEKIVATPLKGGAGVITSLTRADGIIRIPQEVSGLNEGEETVAELLKALEAVEDTLLVIGSHDLTLDMLASMIREKTLGRVQLSSSNVGSLGGLLALRRGCAHVAGSHLLDTETGEYNLSFIRRYLKGVPVTVVTLAHRWQGLMVPPGNPEGIEKVADLRREGLTFVNRQPGSGTRILFDYELTNAGLGPDDIPGYQDEEYTHMNVAVAVLSGAADAGMGIHAAARALGLDFVPVTRERYDLVIPTRFMDDGKMALLLETIRSDAFKEKLKGMGGYEVEETGNVVAEVS